jgi:hypothetical protein
MSSFLQYVRLSGSKPSARTTTPQGLAVTVVRVALRSRTVGFPIPFLT